jgi:CBS domain-containing protein
MVVNLKEFCTVDVVCCTANTRASDAARLMREKHVGDLVVVKEHDDEMIPLGVVTDRDVAVEVLGNGLDPEKTMVASLMRTPVVVAQESEDSSQAIERMRVHGVRRLPIVDAHGVVTGIVTLDDLLRLLVADAGALLQIMEKGQSRERRTRR